MSMVLGFTAIDFFQAFLDETGVRGALVAIAKHAPQPPIRFGEYHAKGVVIIEVDREGTACSPDPEPYRAAIEGVGTSVDWPNEDAPEWLAPLILPGPGWDITALLAEPAMQALRAQGLPFPYLQGSDQARCEAGEQGRELLKVAEALRIVTVYR